MSSAEKKKFECLVREYESGLRAFVRSLGIYHDAVDDLTQETFLTAWRRMDDFEHDRDFGKWLRGIARNLTLNERRKSARRFRIMSDRLTDILESTTGQEESINESLMQIQLGIMKECLDKLPERMRTILLRRYTDKEQAKTLAVRVGISVVALRQVLCRVRKTVRDCMEEKQGKLPA